MVTVLMLDTISVELDPYVLRTSTYMSRGKTLRISAVVTMAGVLLVATVGPTARALTCAPHPSASPQALAGRAESLAVAGSFSDHHDGVIFGRVASRRTNDDGRSADYGNTVVVVEVAGLYGPPVSDGAFGAASASVESSDDGGLVVQIDVEVSGDPATVAARFGWDNHELVLPLRDQGAGVFGATTRFPLVKDYTVVFEAIGEETFVSEPMSLTDIGAVVESAPGAVDADERAARSFSPWLTLGLGLTALSILALLLVRKRAGKPEEPAEW